MESRVVNLKCPNCGDSVAINQKECRCCHQPLIISSFNSVYSMPFQKVDKFVDLYKETLKQNPSSEVNKSIFYAAVCVQGGKKAFFHQRPAIDKILKCINGALMIESKGIYYYMAYIKYDYFERKYFRVVSNYKEDLKCAFRIGFSEADAA